jgi:hypothetical protein
LNTGDSTGSPKINRATKKLHDAIDALGPPPNIIYAGIEEIQWGSYEKVLSALRELVEAGGKPFQDEGFKRFFNLLVRRMGTPRFEEERPDNEKDSERQTFVKTALRICGGEFKPDGTTNLVRLSAKRRERN